MIPCTFPRAARAASLGVLVFSAAEAGAQMPVGRLPDPYLVDSPWGDFPLSRLQPGARLRLTETDGRRTTARLVTLGDTVLEVRADAGAQQMLTLPELRTLRAFEVRAVPLWRRRATAIGAITGVVIGAVAGATGYRHRSEKFAEESWSGYVAARASVGLLLGAGVGHYIVGRARWRPVTIP